MNKSLVSAYDEAMEALSSLITKRSRADKSNKGDRFDVLYDYIRVSFPSLMVLLFRTLSMLGFYVESVFVFVDGCRYWNSRSR